MIALLSGERVALNFLQRLCGIATLTKRFVDALPEGSETRIVDTRKTTPGLRALEREAVRSGGGFNHRARLDGGILIKDNHIAAAGSISEAVRRVRNVQGPALRIEVEVTTLKQLDEALLANAEVIMLDNMTLDQVETAMRQIRGRALVEVSGTVQLKHVEALAKLGVDFISVGALTHSAPAIDLSMQVEPC
jgi:nicotinate-nucleotide pyrophosphorylase (carboxylating)